MREIESFGDGGRFGVAAQERGEFAIDSSDPARLFDPGGGGIGPIGSLRAQLMAALECGERLGVPALGPELMRQVAMSLRVVGLEPNRFLERRNGLILVAQRLEGITKGGVRHVIVGLEADCLILVRTRLTASLARPSGEGIADGTRCRGPYVRRHSLV